jgi:hypothetical protein
LAIDGAGVLNPLRHVRRSALVFDVTDRRQDTHAGLASTRDFTVALKGHAVPNYEMSHSVIFCCDFPGERVWYTVVRDVAAVFEAAFVYQAQRAHATQILSIPIEALEERESFNDPEPIFVFSVGRCGSTLLSSLLKATGRRSVSEPDIFTQLAVMRRAESQIIGPTGTSALIRGSVASFARLCGRGTFLKMRHHCNVLWPQIALAIPDARVVYMLRDRMSWARSRHRVFGDGPETLMTILRDGVVCLASMVRAGLDPQIVWYEDLISDPLSTLRRLNVESDGRGALDQSVLVMALQKDSQEGSNLARTNVKPRETEDACLRAFDALWRQAGLADTLRRLDLARLS